MINVSEEFRREMRDRTDFRAHAEITLADGRQLTVTDNDFSATGVRLTDGAGASGLPLGAAVCRTVQMEIINDVGQLDEYDFFGARIRLWLTFALSETEERIELGTFTVSEPETWGETVTITAADDMIRADRDYTPGQSGERTLGELWRDVCDQCGLVSSGAPFPNSDFLAAAPPEGCTCRQIIGYIAMMAGGNARIDRTGAIQILVYDRTRSADHDLSDWIKLSTDTDDVVITGVETEAAGGKVMEGSEGYVLTVDNPLMEGREADALKRLGDVMIGLTMRRFDGSHVGYPLAECMDTVHFRDRRGREYSSIITDVTFTWGACMELSNSAEGVVRNGSRYVSSETRARQTARKLAHDEADAREALEKRLQKQLAEASGFYTTDVQQEDKSTIRYVHDKPRLEDSSNVIKVTSSVIGFSTDGGKSYPFGLTIDGKTIMDIISANGIYAEWIIGGIINAGKIVLSGEYGSILQGKGGTVVNGVPIETSGIMVLGPKGLDGAMMFLSDAGGRLAAKDGGAAIYVTDGFITAQNGVMRVEDAIAIAKKGTTSYLQLAKMAAGDPDYLEIGNTQVNMLLRAKGRIRIQADEIVMDGKVTQG